MINNDESPIGLRGVSEARSLLAAGNVIHAIKLLRERNDIGLKEATNIVEGWSDKPVRRPAPRAPDEIRALKAVCTALNTQSRERRRHILAAAAILTDISLPGVV